MQITINTADILGDEATIREEVITAVTNCLLASMRKDASAQLRECVETQLSTIVAEKMKELIGMALETKLASRA